MGEDGDYEGELRARGWETQLIYELGGISEVQEIINYKFRSEIGLRNGETCAKIQRSYGKWKVSCGTELWLNGDKQGNMNKIIGSVKGMKGQEGAQGNWRSDMEKTQLHGKDLEVNEGIPEMMTEKPRGGR